jgi:hypothetical protein
MEHLRKIKASVSLFACAAMLASVHSFASAQQLDLTQPGAMYGYGTPADEAFYDNKRVYRIRLTDGATEELGRPNVNRGLAGFFSIDNFSVSGRSHLFGVAASPCELCISGPSILVDLTAAAVNPAGLGVNVGLTTINFGIEAGSAYDFINGTAYVIASDNRLIIIDGQQFPATALYMIDPVTGASISRLSITEGLSVDGLAFGADGVLYATDARLTDGPYKYNFGEEFWEYIGPFSFEIGFNEDSGLAVYRGPSGNETNLYMITESNRSLPLAARLWTVNTVTGAATFVADLRLADGRVAEFVQGFDIPYPPLVGQ